MLSDLIKALQIFVKYKNPSYPTCCEHDVLYVCIAPGIVSDEDKDKLETLGFIPDGPEGFKSFKYGSA